MKRSGILRGALLLTGGNLFMRLCSMGFQVYLSSAVGAAGLGLLQLISSVGIFALALGTSGVRIAAMYLPAQEFGLRRGFGIRKAVQCCLIYGLCVSTLTGLALLFFAKPLALHWIGDIRALPSLQIMAIFLPFTCLCSVMAGYFTACAKIRQMVVVEILERLLSLFITFALLQTWAKGNVERACCAIIGGSSIGCVFDYFVLYALYRRDHYPKSGEALHMPSRLLRLCVPLALNDYLRSGLTTIEHFLIPFGLSKAGNSYESAMADYGTIHGMVFPIMMFPSVILYSLSDLLVPELSRCTAGNRQLRIRSLTHKCLRASLTFAAFLGGFFYVTAASLGKLIYHSETAGRYLMLFAPMVLVLYLDAIVDGMLKGLGQQIPCVRYNTITSFMDVILLFVLLPKLGIAGYYFSFTLTHCINFYWSIRRLCKVTAFQIPLLQWGKPLLCVVVSVGLCRFLHMDGFVLGSLCYWFFCFGLAFVMGAVRINDLLWLKKPFATKS